MEKIEIKKMTLNDFEKMKHILITDFDDFWTPDILKTEILGENKKYIVAKWNGNIVGFAGVLLNFPEMEIMNLVTKKSERQKGIGNLLLEKIIEMANENHFQEIFLEVNEKNRIARRLYEKVGFIPNGIRKNYYHAKDDAMMMLKKLK